MIQIYTPSSDVLQQYARLLVSFALNSGKGVNPKEVVLVQVPEAAKAMYVPLRDAVLQAGAYPIMQFLPDDVDAAGYFKQATEDQIGFFAKKYYKGLIDQIDHSISIIAEQNKYELLGVDPAKILRRSNAHKPYMEWRDQKEARGKFTWTLGMYGTQAMAEDVGMSVAEYWGEIIKACYLDQPDPVAAWKILFAQLEDYRAKLNALEIKSLRVQSEGVDGLPDTDLTVGIGPKRMWLGGSGRNIPSYELFISPDARVAEGRIAFNQPLYRYGNRISGIVLEFEGGRVTKASARENESLLREMIATPGADRIGEFSLTDGSHSRITRPMGETLFDENMGGAQGNTHIALGNAYKDSYPGDASSLSVKDWQNLGYNDSAVHTDIISTARRTVTATLASCEQRVIYKDGHFTV